MKRVRYIFLFLFMWNGFQLSAQQCDLLEIHGDTLITCLSESPCVTLTPSVITGVLNETTSYEINGNVPCPPPPVNNGTPTAIIVDDRWSHVIDLPFTFYYFGQAFDQLIIGDNGVVSFETNIPDQTAGGFCPWRFTATAPSRDLFINTIFGAYHDLYTPGGGNIVYYVSGSYPSRKFVIDFQHVSHFHCNRLQSNNALYTTQRIILHESSNVIDVEIIDKPVCTDWNDGNALIAIQNQNGTVAYVPPGRNTGPWGAQNEMWRFVPSGDTIPTSFSFKWYDESTNTLISTDEVLEVCPDTTTTYRLILDIYRRDTISIMERHTVYVDYSHEEVDLGPDREMCVLDTVTLDATIPNATFYQWFKDGDTIPGANDPVYYVTEAGQYSVWVEIGLCSTSDTVEFTYYDYPIIDLGEDVEICEGDSVTLDATPANENGNETYEWYKDSIRLEGQNSPYLEVNESGTYIVKVENGICYNTDTVQVYVQPMPDLDLGEDQIKCSYETAVVQANITDGDAYEWYVNDSLVATNTTQIEISGTGEYDVTLIMQKNVCTATDSVHVTILEPIVITATPILFGELEVEAQGGLPPYLYALNNGEYSPSNYFTDLPDDDYVVKVKDSLGCEADTIVHVINLIIPPYFTPNNDGINDTWRIGNSELMPGSTLFIYDRYGRLLATMSTEPDKAWNGTFLGKGVLSDDYWYVLVLPNGKIYKGHFSLIR